MNYIFPLLFRVEGSIGRGDRKDTIEERTAFEGRITAERKEIEINGNDDPIGK